MAKLFSCVSEVVREYSPSEAAVEKVFFSINVKSAIALGQGRGAVLAALGANSIPVFEYSPTEIKKSLTCRGRASKLQVREFVGYLLGGYKCEGDDEADALAVAICRAHKRSNPVVQCFK